MASSCPPKGTPGCKARRSWFDTPPLTTLDPPTVPKPENNSKRQSLDVVEILTLTHFTNPPKITFGKTYIGKTKFRTLLLRNPHEFEQEVIIEKFPYKKKFMVNQTRFTVRPEEVFSLQITWAPEEHGGYREMIQFHVNDVYRLQAFLIGTVENLKPPRKIRKFPMAPSVRRPTTVVQTPALTHIRKNYSPSHRQEIYQEIEDVISCHYYRNDNKENSGNVNEDKCKTMDIQDGSVLKCTDQVLLAAETKLQAHTKKIHEEEVAKTPTPLESTAIGSRHEIGQACYKNKRKWRNISDITSPSLNMSPIPVNEGNEHGITVDSYFQANEINPATPAQSEKLVEVNRNDVKMASIDKCFEGSDKHLKETFVVPLPPAESFKNKKKPDVTVENMALSSENRILVTLRQLDQQPTGANETRIIKENDTFLQPSSSVSCCEMSEQRTAAVMCPQHTGVVGMNHVDAEQCLSPQSLQTDESLIGTSEVSPRTMLDVSLNLISQMKVPVRSPDISPKDNNTSINSSLISQGQGIVSPNSFMEDMRSMIKNTYSGDGGDELNNISKLDIASPSLIIHTFPHNIIVNHLQKVRRSLHNSPLTVNNECKTSKMPHASRFGPKRRSITSQFQKEEMRKIAVAAHSIKKDKELLMEDRTLWPKKDLVPMKGSLLTKGQCRGVTGHSKNSNSGKKETGAKITTIKRSSLGRRSPQTRKSPLTKRCNSSLMNGFAVKRVKNKISRKKSSPRKPFVETQNSPNINFDLSLSTKNLTHMTSLGNSDGLFNMITPQKDCQLIDSNSGVLCRSVDSGTVVKQKSDENSAENSGRFFDCLFQDENGQREDISKNSSLRREKLFPDIHSVDCHETDEISHMENGVNFSLVPCDDADNKKIMCRNDFTHEHCDSADKITFEIDKVGSCPRRDHLEGFVNEVAVSPHRFSAVSESNLPTSPLVSLDHSKRGTITLTKSRTSDALLSAMNNNRLCLNSSHKPPSYCLTEDDTETQENIRVDIEERYQEIEGNMYVIVKETTNVVKSTTETYMEQLVISPQQFQTPTRLPNSPDLLMTRRSTHVIRSPKVINISSLNKRQINFIEQEEYSKTKDYQLTELVDQKSTELIEEENSLSLSPTHETLKCSMIKSDTFEKEPTILTTPDRYLQPNKSEPPITSVCASTSCLVDYEVCSESGSTEDVTRDSLEINQSVDLLASAGTETSLCKEENKHVVDERQIEMEGAASVRDFEKSITLFRKGHDQNCTSQIDNTNIVSSQIVTNDDLNKGQPSIAVSDESDDEQFYDTMSEKYYDALSDTGKPEMADIAELEEDDESVEDPRNHISDFSRNCQLKIQGIPDNSLQKKVMCRNPVMKTDSPPTDMEVQMNINMRQQTQVIEMSIDHRERFEFTEREVIDLHTVADLKPLDEIISSTPEAKLKRKLRRSVSADTLLENQLCLDDSAVQKHSRAVHFNSSPSSVHTNSGSRKYLTQSKSVILTKQLSTRYSPVKTSQGQIQSCQKVGSAIKQRSQSLSNLSRQIERSSLKNEHHAKDKKGMANQDNQVSQVASKQKTAKKGVAQNKLILVKKSKSGIPRHPLLFAAKNMYYDERWMEKQERGFVQWLNFVLTPPDEYVAVTSKTKIDAGSLSLNTGHVAPRLAPTKEILSFRAYAARRRLNRLRRSACALYQSETIVNIIRKIEVEVESRRLCVRKDKMVHADVGIKQKLLDLLLHYSSLWLRIGLETIFGEALMLQSNQDVVGLSRFILTRLLASPDIAAEFAHPTVPHLYKQGYEAAVSRHTVKKFLLLVYFLDQAKSSRLIDHDPCLFCKDAGIKSSKEILVEFSREVLSGEGDITRHLAYLGYTVCQTQKQIDEFDFAVVNLSSDLRDGLRLCRILELLAGDHSIMTKLRTPAISLLQKVHNTGIFFKAMRDLGLDFSTLPGLVVTAKDVVDGHREKTLSLLWQLIIYFQSSIQVNETHLREEIDILTKSLQLKVAMQKIGAMSIDDCEARRDSGETRLIMENKRLQLILQWCRLVCLHYGVQVENFTVSFSDGRALCCLLHHYHPALLPLAEIHFQTTISFQENAEDKCQIELDPDISIDWGSRGGGLIPDENSPALMEQLLANEKSNYKTLYEKVSALGGVPLMLKFADMSNTIPDEKVVSTYVSYLCARLLDIREEVKAARIMQMAWRRKQLRRAVEKRQRRTRAAITIQRWIRPYLVKQVESRETCAATYIQAAWRGHVARLFVHRLKLNIQEAFCRERKEQSVLTLQRLWRSRSARHQLAQFKEKQKQDIIHRKKEVAVVTIQKHVRGFRCRKEFLEMRATTIKIQAMWRRHLAMKIFSAQKQEHLDHSAVVIQKWMKRNYCMNRYRSLITAVLMIQKHWRMRHAMRILKLRQIEKYLQAVTTIQKYVRAKFVQKKFQHLRQAVIVLQSSWRMKQAKKELTRLKAERQNKAALLIQSFFKSVICRQNYFRMKQAVIILQKCWKRTLAQQALNCLKIERDNKAAVVIQKYFKGYRTLQHFYALRRSAVILQTTWRMVQAKKELKYLKQKHQEHAVLVIQRYYRGFKSRQELRICKSAATTIQKLWRMHRAKKILAKLKLDHQVLSAVTIQRYYRGFIQRRNFTSVKAANIVIQKSWRMILALKFSDRLQHEKQTNSALVLQKNFKMWKHRIIFLRLKSAVVVLQSTWKMAKVRRWFLAMRLMRQEKSAILIQKMWKGYLVHQTFVSKRVAALKIQSYWRMFRVRKDYWRRKEAALLIQVWHRGNMKMKRQQSVYMRQRIAAIYIQNWWRCRMLTSRFQTMRHSAVVIQANFRSFCCRQKFLKVKLAILIIQHGYKHYLAGLKVRNEFLVLRQATVIIQRNFRRYLQNKNERLEAAALVLQTVFRKTNARRKYIKQKLAAQIIQLRFREYVKMKALRQSFLHQRQAVCIIQTAYRTLLMKRHYMHFRYSVTIIQSCVKGRIKRNEFNNMKNAAIVIQRRFRAFKMSQDYREAFLQLRTSAIIIQRFYRAVKVQRKIQKDIAYQESAVTKIQAVYRGWSQRQDYLLLRAAAVCLQRRYRSYLAGKTVRSQIGRMRNAACIIQNKWRSNKLVQEAKRKIQQLRNEMEAEIKLKQEEETLESERMEKSAITDLKVKAAVVLQRSLRAYVNLKNNTRRQHAALVIQKSVRGHQSRVRYYAELKQILYLQCLIRGFVCRQRFQRMKLAASIIQTRWRDVRQGRRYRSEYIAKREAVVKIQAHFLMARHRNIHQNNMNKIVIIQAHARAFLQRHRFERTMKQILVLQRRVKSIQQMRKDRKRFLKLRHSAIKIQTVVRLWLAYRYTQQERSILQMHFRMQQQPLVLHQAYNAINLQKSFMDIKRRQLDTQKTDASKMAIPNSYQVDHIGQAEVKHLDACIVQCFLTKSSQEQNTAAFIIQGALKRYMFRRQMIKTKYAVMLQAHIRRFLCRHNYLAVHRSVVVLQAAVRGWRVRKLLTAQKRQHSAICLQACIRGFLVRRRLSPILKERHFAVQDQKRLNRAALRIQAWWRGYVTRRNTKDKKLSKARKRLQEASQCATKEKTLGSRTSSALDYLLRERDLAHILEALMHLEVSTRLSPECCEKMAEVNAVSVLYQLINSCNRSTPHMELIKYSVNILLNLAKYEKTVSAIMEPPECVSTIVELLQIYREKGPIFYSCCMLLGMLGLHPGRKEQILRHPLIVDRLQSIHVLALRKQRKTQNRQVTQAKMAAMKNFNCTMPVLTPSKSKRRWMLPDWALAQDIKGFDDTVSAVTYVMDALQIKPKI